MHDLILHRANPNKKNNNDVTAAELTVGLPDGIPRQPKPAVLEEARALRDQTTLWICLCQCGMTSFLLGSRRKGNLESYGAVGKYLWRIKNAMPECRWTDWITSDYTRYQDFNVPPAPDRKFNLWSEIFIQHSSKPTPKTP